MPMHERRVLRPAYEGPGDAPATELSARCAAVVADIAFDASALPITLIRFQELTDGVLCEVVIEVPDRNVPDRIELLTVGRVLICPWLVLERNGPGYLVGWLRETVANLLFHEASESLSYRGVRVFDPHALPGVPGSAEARP